MKKLILLYALAFTFSNTSLFAQDSYCGEIYYGFWSNGPCSFLFSSLENAYIGVDQCGEPGNLINICNTYSENIDVCDDGNWTCTDIYDTATPNIVANCRKFDNWQNGVTLQDRSVLVLHLNGQIQITNPFLLVAADMNNDGVLNAADVAEMNSIINDPTYVPTNAQPGTVFTPWRFMNGEEFHSAVFINDFCADPFSTTVDYPNYLNGRSTCFPVIYSLNGEIYSAGRFNFFGFKTGDLDFDAETLISKGSSDRSASNQKEATSINLVVKENDQGNELEVYFPESENLVAYQFKLNFDKDLVQIDAIESMANGIFDSEIEQENGVINFSLTNTDYQGAANFMANTPVVKIRYQSASANPGLFTLSNSPNHSNEVLFVNKNARSFESFTDYDEFIQSKPFLTKSIQQSVIPNDVVHNVIAYPNPFTTELTLNINAKVAHEAVVDLYNLSGQLIRRFALPLDAGISNHRLDLSDLEGNLFVWRVQSEYLSVEGKAFKKN